MCFRIASHARRLRATLYIVNMCRAIAWHKCVTTLCKKNYISACNQCSALQAICGLCNTDSLRSCVHCYNNMWTGVANARASIAPWCKQCVVCAMRFCCVIDCVTYMCFSSASTCITHRWALTHNCYKHCVTCWCHSVVCRGNANAHTVVFP